MARELILMSDVDGLGIEGQIVKVSEGYARNFLVPRKLAVPVTPAALKRLEKHRIEREARQQKDREGARALADSLEKISCTIPVKVGENDQLFGAIHAHTIAEALKALGFTIERRHIHLAEPIRELGVFTVPIRLHPDVEASLKVWIVGE